MLRLPHQCMAVNANGIPCRNAGKSYRVTVDGTFDRASFFCEFHCAMVSAADRAWTIEKYLDGYQNRLTVMREDENEEERAEVQGGIGDEPVQLELAPLSGTAPDGRVA